MMIQLFDRWTYVSPPGPENASLPPSTSDSCCLCAVRLGNARPQELPDPLSRLGRLGGTEGQLVDVGQAVAHLQVDIDPGSGGRLGQAFGIAEKQVRRSHLHEQRRETG